MKRICSVLLIFSGLLSITISGFSQWVFKTSEYRMAIDKSGNLIEMTDLRSGKNYVDSTISSPLLSIQIGDSFIAPSKAKFTPNQNKIQLIYNSLNVNADVKYSVYNDYITFELVKISSEEKIKRVLWGPFSTQIDKTIGEIVGVVRNSDYAIGIQSLNVKTIGGYPYNAEGQEQSRGSAARKTNSGSQLQAYSINRTLDRKIMVWDNKFPDMPVKPIKAETCTGSKIALFGCDETKVLSIIGTIEIEQGLPHPLINGVWSKISNETGRSYLIADFSESNIDTLLEITQKAGLMSLYHMNAFKNWGHYELDSTFFPHGSEGLKNCVKKAQLRNIRLGAHTLSNFITTNDAYVHPVPDNRLAKTGYSILIQNIDSFSTSIEIESPVFFNNVKNNDLHSIVIDNEIIRYKTVSSQKPWILQDCERAAFGTKNSQHSAGTKVGKLMDHPYKVFFPDQDLQEEIALNLALRYNETGLSQMDFDGHEGCLSSGQGDYSIDKFALTFYKNLDHEVINGSSLSKHFYWHINNYCNWGEPWYGGFAESMQEYRIKNQDLLSRNYLPNMLGWYLLTEYTKVNDMEWMLARAAGYNAGFAMVTSMKAITKNTQIDTLILCIHDWEYLRRSGVFSFELREKMKDAHNEFHLEKKSTSCWNLFAFHKTPIFKHEYIVKQPGEPTDSKWIFENPDNEQFIQFKIVNRSKISTIRNIHFILDNYKEFTLPMELLAGESCLVQDSVTITIYDDKGRVKKDVLITNSLPKISKGSHEVSFNCSFDDSESEPLIECYFKFKSEAEEICVP